MWPVLRDSLRWVSAEPGSLLFVSDADGHLLWVEGDHDTRRRAERVHLAPGARWSEETAGTCGIGTTLALRRPFQVAGAEHFLTIATGYTCTAAPIRDPATGKLLGAVDLTSGPRTTGPLAMSLLTTAARLVETELRTTALREQARLQSRYARRLSLRTGVSSALVTSGGLVIHADPPGWLPQRLPGFPADGPILLPDGRSAVAEQLTPGGPYLLTTQQSSDEGTKLRFTGLGRDRASLQIGELKRELSPRHSELLAILLANPGGLPAEPLACELYGPSGKALTVRAELARLRPLLGHRLASEPYRLKGDVWADFVELERQLGTIAVHELLDRYPGPFLPASKAPGVLKTRARLHQRIRHRVLTDGDVDVMTRWTNLACDGP